MPVTGGAAGVKLVLRTFKHLSTRPDTTWVNNYEFNTIGTWDTDALYTAAVDFKTFEQAFHSNKVVFDRWTVSTWAPDSKPYDPTAFMGSGYPPNTVGAVDMSGTNELEPLDVVLWVERSVATGRQGKLFYRGAAGEEMVTSPAGVPTPQGTGFAAQFTTALPSVNPYMGIIAGSAPLPPLQLMLISKTGAVRPVTGLVPRGIAINKRDRAYFDRL